jgi:transposase-like protein
VWVWTATATCFRHLASPASDGAKYWLSVLTDLKNRGVADVFFLIYDGLKDLLDVVETERSLPIMQTYVTHLMRNTFKYASKKDWDELRRDAKPIWPLPHGHKQRPDTMSDQMKTRIECVRFPSSPTAGRTVRNDNEKQQL